MNFPSQMGWTGLLSEVVAVDGAADGGDDYGGMYRPESAFDSGSDISFGDDVLGDDY